MKLTYIFEQMAFFYSTILLNSIVIAYILDLIFGDPVWLYHPVRVIGKVITTLEKSLYNRKNKKFFGGILAFVVITLTFITSYSLSKISLFFEVYFLYTTFATKSLAQEGKKVVNILESGDIERAKKELSYLVSRDTKNMEKKDIIRGILETISENSVDGVIAPMFYAFLGSFFSLALPFAMTYKAINTLDSMVGYKNDRYIDFGMISAKIDDVANFIPARLGGGIIIPLASFILKLDYKSSWRIFFRDRLKHSSPNSGNPESAFAGALGVQFGGKTSYFGKIYEKPTIGDKINEFEISQVKIAINLLYLSSFVTLILFILLRFFIMSI